jgi:tetratricopeptide (TPR) repeat protein
MTAVEPFERALAAAVALREDGEDEAARDALLELHSRHPQHPQVNLQCAWIHDKLGLEAEAVPYYEKALGGGLEGEDLHDALLGLGSTYRALGRYDEAMHTLDRAVSELPASRDLEVFRAMALYNTGRAKEACETLLRLLVETTSDEEIKRYRGALDEYAADLDRTWA